MSDSDGADPTPSGSNSAPKPRRQRMQHSCDNCKKRKIRCDSAARGGNACSHCVALRIECQHTAQRKKRGPPAGRSLHLKSANIQALTTSILSSVPYIIPEDEAELRKILKELAGYIRILEKELAETSRISSVELGESEGQITSESSDNDEGDDELSKQLEELSFTYSRNRYYGPFNRIKLIKSAIDGKETNAGNQEPVQIFKRPLFWDLQPWQILPEPRLEPLVFPPQDLFNDLIDLWFEKSAPYFPLFHRPTLMKSISSGLHYYDRHFGETLLAMCALASRHSEDSRSFTYGSKLSAGFIWMQQVNPVPTSFLEPATLPQVQKLILYIMFMQTTSTPWPGWVLTGLGFRLLQDVGAHRKNGVPPSVSGELWKRAFWTINYIDLSLALYVGRPRVVTPDDYDVDFPEEVDDEYWEQPGELPFKQPPGKPCQLTYYIHMLKLVSILESVHRGMSLVQRATPGRILEPEVVSRRKKAISDLNKSLNDWLDALPEQLKWDPERLDIVLFHQSTMLHLMYYFLRIIINWPRKASSAESLEICVTAAQSCIHLMNAHRKRDYVSLGPQMLATIAHAATILAINVWKSKQLNLDIDINAEMENVLRCMDHLKRFEHRIQIAGRNWDTILNVIYISNLANEYNRAKESLGAKADSHQAIAMESGSDIADTSLTPLSTAILDANLAMPTTIPSFGQPQSWNNTQYPAYDPSLQNPLDAPIPMSDAYISSVLPTFESYVGAPIGSLGNLVPPDIPSSYSAPQAELGNLQQQDWTSIAATSDAMDINEADWDEYMETVDEALRALRQS